MFVAVLGKLVACYTAQEMFTEAESVHQIQLSLLNERPDANQQDLATGWTDGQHWALHAFTLPLVCCRISQYGKELYVEW